MARRKKRTGDLPKDFILPEDKPEGFLTVDSAIWWDANPDKSKLYRRKEFKRKKFLTPKEAEMFLEISGDWLSYFVQGNKGFPKLLYTWDKKNVATVKFAREDLVKYREMLQERKSNTKTRPQRK